MNVEIERTTNTNAIGYKYPGLNLILKDADGTVIYTHKMYDYGKHSDKPIYKFFDRNGETWCYLGNGCVEKTLVNTNTRQIHQIPYYKNHSVFLDVFPSPTGQWIAALEEDEIYFYALDVSNNDVNLKFVCTDDEDYMNDEFLLEVDGNETFGWIDSQRFSFEHHGKFKVIFEFLEDGTIIMPVKERFYEQS